MHFPTYILKDKTPIPEPDYSAWQEWFFTANRHVDDTMVGHLRVSTVFMGLDHQFCGNPPLLFETIIFDTSSGENESVYEEQCATWDQAEQMHKRVIERAHALLEAR